MLIQQSGAGLSTSKAPCKNLLGTNDSQSIWVRLTIQHCKSKCYNIKKIRCVITLKSDDLSTEKEFFLVRNAGKPSLQWRWAAIPIGRKPHRYHRQHSMMSFCTKIKPHACRTAQSKIQTREASRGCGDGKILFQNEVEHIFSLKWFHPFNWCIRSEINSPTLWPTLITNIVINSGGRWGSLRHHKFARDRTRDM